MGQKTLLFAMVMDSLSSKTLTCRHLNAVTLPAKRTACLNANDLQETYDLYHRDSEGLAVSCALSRLRYDRGLFCERYEWKLFHVGYARKGILC